MIQKVKQYMEELTPLPKPAYKERGPATTRGNK